MSRPLVDQIAAAVLYEGYILYPYRPSVKNRQRWTFGGLYPRGWCEETNTGDSWVMQSECLVVGRPGATIEFSVRFLHLVARTVGELQDPLAEWPAAGDPPFRPIESMRIGDRLFQSWQEATERQIAAGKWDVASLAPPRFYDFSLPAARTLEPLRDADGRIVGVLERRQESIRGSVEMRAEAVADGLFKVGLRIMNGTPAADRGRDDAQMRSLISTHAVLTVDGSDFVSLTDPPACWQEAADSCRNLGCWPALVGNAGDRDTVLASPIILPDYPEIAPESPGDLFDGTEIDEILTLRILTLTDDEKRTAMAVDDRAKRLLQRTEALARDQLARLHGSFRPIPEAAAHE